MAWEKKNLVTKKDSKGMYDEYECSECGFKKRHYTFQIEGSCPKCTKANLPWLNAQKRDIQIASFGGCGELILKD